jgi:hypothetical protein
MKLRVSHSRELETPEAKARWFQSLPLSTRMDLLCAYTDLILENNPQVLEKRNAEPASGRVRLIRKE